MVNPISENPSVINSIVHENPLVSCSSMILEDNKYVGASEWCGMMSSTCLNCIIAFAYFSCQ